MADEQVASLFAKMAMKLDQSSFGAAVRALQGVEQGAEHTEAAVESTSKSLSKLADKAAEAAGRGLKVLAAGLAGIAVGALALVQRTAAAGAAIDDMAKRTGASVRELQRLSFSAQQSGTTMEAVESAIRKLSNAIVDAKNASSPAAKAFAQLHLSASELAKMGVEERLGAVGEALSKVEDDTLRTALAMDVLGKGGTELSGLFEGGAAGLRELGDAAEVAGAVLDDQVIANAAKLDDTLALMQAQLAGVAGALAGELMPIVQQYAEEIIAWVSANRELIATKVEEFIRNVVPVVELLARRTLSLISAVASLIDMLGGAETAAIALGVAFAALKVLQYRDAIMTAGKALQAFSASAYGPAGAIAAAAALGFALGTAMDKAFGLSDALAGVNQQEMIRQRVPTLGELTAAEKSELRAAQQERDRYAEINSDNSRSDYRSIEAQNAAQRRIDAVFGAANARYAGMQQINKSRGLADKGAAEGTKRNREAKDQADQARTGLRQLGDLGRRGLSNARGVLSGVGDIEGPKTTTRRRGGGGGKSKKPEESLADMLERDFGGGKGGSLRDAAGGGASATAGATFVRIDASYNAPTTITLVLPKGSLGRNAEEQANSLGNALGRTLDKRNRDAAEHFHKAVRP